MKRFLSSACIASLLVSPAASEEAPGPAKAPPAAEASPGGAPQAPAALPRGVVARVNGRDVTLDEYVNYLLASLGRSRLDEYVNRLLVEEKAKASGVALEPAEVEAAVQETIERTIKSQYRGDRDVYAEALRRRHRSLEEEVARLRQELYYDMLLERWIVRSRKVSEADVARRFEEVYGEGGVQYVLRHVLVSTRPRAVSEEGHGGAEAAGFARRTPKEARERAEEARREVLRGVPFSEVVRKYSDDPYTRRAEGRIPRYRAKMFGESFHAAVERLTPENRVSEVVESPRGYHVIELVEKRTTKLEDVRAEIESWLKTAPPSARERQEALRGIREAAKIEGLD